MLDHRSPALRRGAALAGLWVGVFGVTLWLMMQRLVIVRDEAWMLWLATRLSRGDTLYRDAYDVTTPLAAWLAAGIVRVFGVEMATVRACAAATFATQVVLAVSVARACGMRFAGRVVLVLVLLALAAPFVAFVSLYSAVAILFGLATLRATLWWLDRRAPDEAVDGVRARWPAVTIGSCGALAFWSKPNVGVLAALAVGATLLAAFAGARDARRLVVRDAVWVACAAGAVSVACMAVIAASGAWSPFVDQVFRSKGEYLKVGFGYFPALRERFDQLFDASRAFQLRMVPRLLVQVSPLVVLVATPVGVARARRADRSRVVASAAFTFAGLLSVLPRPGLNHLTGAMPLVIPALAALWAQGLERTSVVRTRAHVALALAGGLAVVALVAASVPLVDPPHPERFERSAAHFEGTPVARRQLDSSARLRRDLRARGIESVFIVRKDAGFLYLRTGTSNPLPYDIPERSDFGGEGERGVIARIERGDAEWVCVRRAGSGSRSDSRLVPRHLETWVRRNLEPVGAVARCDLFRASARRPPRQALAGTGASRPEPTAPDTAA